MLVCKQVNCFIAAAGWALFVVGSAQAAVPETVTVGNPGNAADAKNVGAVDYVYKIGKYEVTNAEYCEFLNAVAKTDTHRLYDSRMGKKYGGIKRSGSSGDFTYSVKDGAGSKPVNFVTFESCARYVNWLSNGQGQGDTETGSYTFSGDGAAAPDHAALAKDKSTKWVLPSENEWYKAAYFDPNKEGGAGYWKYPAKSDSAPDANISSDAISDVGSYKDAVSPYGTHDQGGNMWEYNDNRRGGKVGLRGGSFFLKDRGSYMRAASRYSVYSAKWPNYGFRVVALGGAETK